jgi:hypothetical protein
LGDAFYAAFPRTDPLWYGLWINSPLLKTQVELLHAVLNVVFANWERRGLDIDHFLLAIQAAAQWQLPLHVSMFLPGILIAAGTPSFLIVHVARPAHSSNDGKRVTRRNCNPAVPADIRMFLMGITSVSETKPIGMRTTSRSKWAKRSIGSS